jgi:4-azaleucine resistance transporter AzlC
MDTLPLCIAVIPWGILTGAIAIQVGMSPLQAQLMSLLVFAGAAQLSGMTMMANATPLLPLFASTFVISSRHLLYSVVFRQHVVHLPLHRRLLMGFVLTDEMFAVSEAHTKRSGQFSETFAFVSGFSFYVIWNLATTAGIIAGEYFNNLESLGLDFAIAATFIAMTFTDLRRFPVLVAVLVSGTLSVLLKPVFTNSYIVIAALLGMLAAYLLNEPHALPDEKSSSGVSS